MIEAHDIGVHKGRRWIARQLSLSLAPGEMLAVIGANGAGKSTLLKVLAGEERPHAGRVELNGCSLGSWQPGRLARVRAVLSQQLHLPFPMEALEVAKLGRYPYRENDRERTAIARECLQQVGMEAFEKRNILTLSGGEQQRVHLARVLAQLARRSPAEPRFLLLDEPTSSLDIAQQHQLLALLQGTAARQNVGIFIVLHDMNLAAQYAGRIALLRKGRLIASGSSTEVLTPLHIQKAFGIRAQVTVNPHHGCPQVFACPVSENEINELQS